MPKELIRFPGWKALAFLVLLPAAQSFGSELGVVDFPTSAGPEAQEAFLEGVLWLHSFEYEDAREHFQRALEVEPGFVMATWGEAMTHNYPIWMRQEPELGRQALDRLAPTREERLAKAPTARERRYLEAVEILFGEGEKEERDFAYAEAMKSLAQDLPGDLEAASFYALSLLGTCHEGRDIPTYMRAAAIVEEVFAKNPKHPGAAHYLIHSYDDPIHAPLGLRAARVYAGIAPAAEHALHMPSHIFLALGMWDETAASNEDSFNAAEARVQRRGQGVDRRGYHAMLWLHYAYLQQGRFREAAALLDSIQGDLEKGGSLRTRRHYAQMRAQEVLETQRWEDLRPSPDHEDLQDSVIATDLFATGYAAVHLGKLAEAKAALEALENLAASAKGEGGPGEVEVEVEVSRLQLAGLVAIAERRGEEGLELLQQAAREEERAPFGFGPPMPVKPAHELLGEYLAEKRRLDAAREHFEKALERTPRRTRSLRGLAGILCIRGGKEAGEGILGTLLEVGRRADSPGHAWAFSCGPRPNAASGETKAR